MLKRFIAVFLALVLTISLIGCGKTGRQPIKLTLSTEDSEAILAAAGIHLPDAEEAKGAHSIVKWYSNTDFHNYREDEIVNTGFYTFTEKYGCDSEWIEYPDYGQRWDYLANLILSGSSPDFMYCETDLFPLRAIKGVITPVNDYIDYDDPLFKDMKSYAEDYFSIGEKTYFILTDMGFDTVVPYNRRVMEEYGFDDPAELFANDEWTWDRFMEMCLDFTDPDEERYALDGWYYSAALLHSCGTTTVGYDSANGKFYSNLDDPRLERAQNLLYELNKGDVIYPWWNGWTTRNGGNGAGVKEGLTLFWMVAPWGFTEPVEIMETTWGDIGADEVMFVPMPRDPNGDGKYYIDARPNGYALVNGAQNPEGVALLAMCERFKIIDPTVVSIDRRQLEETYLWTDHMLQMYDTCYDLANTGAGNIVIGYGAYQDGGYGPEIGEIVKAIEQNAQSVSRQGAKSWAQLKEENSVKLEYYIDELNKSLEEFEQNGYKAVSD